jgi:ABC-type spermidine/putrescine transport system permease subunit I
MILLRLQVIKLLLFRILINPNARAQEFARLCNYNAIRESRIVTASATRALRNRPLKNYSKLFQRCTARQAWQTVQSAAATTVVANEQSRKGIFRDRR